MTESERRKHNGRLRELQINLEHHVKARVDCGDLDEETAIGMIETYKTLVGLIHIIG